MSEIKQQARNLELITPSGKDKLVLKSVVINEAISSLFKISVSIVSDDKNFSLTELIGKNVTLRMSTPEPDAKHQYFNGFVSRFSVGSSDRRLQTYHAEVVPWLWFLTQTTDLRIFQKKKVSDIIQSIFEELGFSDFKFKLQGNFEPREYCVQYRETDFAFISRLMEEEGIFYFFEHKEGKHTLVISNEPGVHQEAAGFSKFRYVPKGGVEKDDGGIESWRSGQLFRPGKYALNDYHFQMPTTSLKVNAPTAVKLSGNDKYELYDYPGDYAKRFDGDDRMGKVLPDGERTAKLGMQRVEANHKEVQGESSQIGMYSGNKFSLVEHERADANGAYVLTSVRHVAEQNPLSSGGTGDQSYSCSFTCIPAGVPFRPQRTTPKPIVHGLQTAVVVGVQGEEIDTDKYGRVKVQFHWDREGKKDANSSCWIRVSTPLAGTQWGMIHIPRIGQEVIVAFLEGDPDQPIIVGSVYNYANMPPWKLPENKTMSGLVTRSTLKGNADTYNELCFEDKKGEELVYLRAEKDLIRAVENDETHWVGHDRWAEVDNKDTLIVDKGDREATLKKGNDKLTIELGNRESKIDTGNDTLTISKGNQTTKVDLGKSSLEAMQSIELKVGSNSIKIDQTGVTISGLMVDISGNTKTAVSGAVVQVSGTGMTEVTGAVVKIN